MTNFSPSRVLKKAFLLAITTVIFTFSQSINAKTKMNRGDVEKKSYGKKFANNIREEVLKNFTLLGKPITPAIFNWMEPQISDLIPGILAVDLLASIGSNQFSDDFTSTKGEKLTWHSLKNRDEEDRSFYDYAFIGKIGQDKCIIVTRSNGGGTLTTSRLIILKIVVDKGYDWDNSAYEKQAFDKPVPRYRVLAKQIAYLYLSFVGDFVLEGNVLKMKRKDLGKENIIDLSKIAKA